MLPPQHVKWYEVKHLRWLHIKPFALLPKGNKHTQGVHTDFSEDRDGSYGQNCKTKRESTRRR